MENFEISTALEELADLLEIQGANPFRIRAYRNAIRTIDGLTRPLRVMAAAAERLTDLPGVGKEIAAHIEELLATGRLTVLDEVAKEVPRELVVLVKLEGVGPKKAKKLYDELGITSIDALEEAIREGLVHELAGFGRKSADKILQSIEDLRTHQGRTLLWEADELVAVLLDYIRRAPGIRDSIAAGSYRRRQETIGDLDILVMAEDDAAPAIMEHFLAYPAAARVEAGGGTKGRIQLRGGLSADLRILPPHSYGAALHYFTGSKEHNVAIRKLAVRKGLRISEYGVFRTVEEEAEGDDAAEAAAADGAGAPRAGGAGAPGADGAGAPRADGAGGPGAGETATSPEIAQGERIGGETEEEVFAAVGLPWIPPVLRENRGEIEAAREGRLPRLVTLNDIRADLHMHSDWSDGKVSIREMAERCRKLGYEYLAITDHSKAVTVANGLDSTRVREQWKEIDRVRGDLEGITLFRGLEVDILKDGSLDLPDEELEGLDLVIASVHSYMNMPMKEMTERVIRALEHPAVDILAHPTGRILNRRTPYEIDVEAVLTAARDLDVAVELNASPYRLDLRDTHVFRARELGVRVAIDTDAHSPDDLDRIEYGIDQAQRGWLEPKDVLNTMPLADFEEWLDRRAQT